MTYNCGAIYAKEKCACGRSPVMWTRHVGKHGDKYEDYWKCGCGKEYQRNQFTARRGRRRKA